MRSPIDNRLESYGIGVVVVVCFRKRKMIHNFRGDKKEGAELNEREVVDSALNSLEYRGTPARAKVPASRPSR